MERTLALVKPDGVERCLIGEVIAHYERKGLHIADIKMVVPTRELVEEHYKEHKGKDFFDELVDYLTGKSVVAMIVEGTNAVSVVRKVNGNKNPLEAELGSIRGKYAFETTKNLVHASDCIETAKREINLWFQ